MTSADQLTAAALLVRAADAATTTRERQLVAIAEALLDGNADRVDVLAREHLTDHPDHLLVAFIAAMTRPGNAMTRQETP